MTTVELAMLVVRHTQWATPTEMPLSEARALAMCLSDGLAKVRQHGGEQVIREPFDVWFRSPTAVLVGATNGSATISLALSGAPLTADTDLGTCDADTWPLIVPPPITDQLAWVNEALGSCISIGDGWHNRLGTRTSLLWRHLGPDYGTTEAIILHDTTPLGIDNIVGIGDDLEVCDLRGNSLAALTATDAPLRVSERDLPDKGQPRQYRLVALTGGLGTDPGMGLRVWPAPDTAYRVKGTCLRSATKITLEDLRTPRTLPHTEEIIEQVVMPLAMARALREKLLSNPDATNITDGASTAMTTLAIETSDRGRAARPVGTKKGF